MMKHEFEELAGYEVSWSDYQNIIEPMYMATNLTKQEFVKVIDKKRFALPTKAQIIREMKALAKTIFEGCGIRTYHEEEAKLWELAKQYAERFWGLHWVTDMDAYLYFTKGYAYCGVEQDRGCTFIRELVIGYKDLEYERIKLAA